LLTVFAAPWAKGVVLSDADIGGQSDTRTLATVLGWLVAISLFAAGAITTLLEFDITASPPRETAPNDLVERWPLADLARRK
jgi:hypothetical protein